MFRKKAGYFGFDSSSKQRSRAVAQNIGQSIGEGPWLNQSKNVSVGHGVSLLRWRSGGVKHPHDTPPYPFMPSPTFANSSVMVSAVITIKPNATVARAAELFAKHDISALPVVDDNGT